MGWEPSLPDTIIGRTSPDDFRPSTDIAQAFELLEWMPEGYFVGCYTSPYTVTRAWIVGLLDNRGVLQGSQSALTPQEAICKAYITYKEGMKG